MTNTDKAQQVRLRRLYMTPAESLRLALTEEPASSGSGDEGGLLSWDNVLVKTM